MILQIQSVTLFHNLLYLLLKALQERLDREAAGLKAKLSEADERTAKVGSGYTQQKQYFIFDKIQNRDTCHLIYSSFKIQQESKALAAKLEAEKNALAAQLETGNKEVAERMQKEEEQRKREADEMKVIVFDISTLLT